MDPNIQPDGLGADWFAAADLSAELKIMTSNFYDMCTLNPAADVEAYQQQAVKISAALNHLNIKISLYVVDLLQKKDMKPLGEGDWTSLKVFFMSVLSLNAAVEHARGVFSQALLELPAEDPSLSALQEGLACFNAASGCVDVWLSVFDVLKRPMPPKLNLDRLRLPKRNLSSKISS